jgi:hypothetical protein
MHIGVHEDDSTAKVGGLQTAALHLEAKKGNRNAQAARQFFHCPSELGRVELLFLIHDITYLIRATRCVAEEMGDAPRTIRA